MNHSYSILSRLGIHRYREDKDEILADCIFCGDKKENLQINFVKRVFHCWSCNKGGSIYKLINIITGLNQEDAIRLFHLDEVNVDQNVQEILSIMKDRKKKTYYYKRFMVSYRHKYWKLSRGINRSMVNEFYLGIDQITNRLVIPLMENEKCYGLVRRAISTSQKPKYLTTKGFDNSKFIYGYDSVDMDKDYVVITEGCIDAIVSRQLGLNSVAVMGVEITQDKLQRIANDFDRVMLMFDNDHPGKSATDKISKRFIASGCDTYRIEYDAEDPGSLKNIDQVKSYVRCSII